MEKMCVICNPLAGQGNAARTVPALRSMLSAFDGVGWADTAGSGDAVRLASQSVRDGVDVIVAAGGDGTVSEIVNGLMSARDSGPMPLLAILPVGSANDFAAALAINSPAEGLARLRQGIRRAVDIGELSNGSGDRHYFCMSAGIGIVAAIAAERNRIRRLRGSSLYFLAAARAILRRPELLHLELGFDGAAEEAVRVGALLAHNSPRSGGFTLAPGADMSDGILDVLALREHTRPLTPFRLIQLLLAVRAGTHLNHGEITQRRCQALTLIATQPLLVQLDGELHRLQRGKLLIRLLPSALIIAA